MRYGAICAATAGLFMAAGQAHAGSFSFSTTADWNTGSFASTNAGPPGFDQLQLNPNVVTTFNHIWVAASGRGTVIRINTDTGAVLGEYYTAPNGRSRNPSRTTVDINGDVWVGNRDESSGGQGSIAKISAGATGPDTSTGVFNAPTGAPGTFDARPWTNAGGADNAGGASTASDPAILHYVRTPSTNNRTIAIDANNDVWVSGTGNRVHHKVDGETGALLGVPSAQRIGGYGGVIDSNGVLWSSDFGNARIGRYDTSVDPAVADPSIGSVSTGGQSYGLAVDSGGNIWNSHWTNNSISKHSSDGTKLFTVPSGGLGSRGVAVTPDDDIWIANSNSNTVTRLANDGTLLATIPVGRTPTGVAVDSNGKVWVTNFDSNSTMRINPATNAVDLTVELGPGATPYNYSDMTGSVIGGVTNPTGTWTALLDSGMSRTRWDNVFWNTEPEGDAPDGTSITIQLRAADDQAALGGLAWTSFASGDALGLTGRYAEVRAILTRTGTGAGAVSPILSDLTVTATPIPLPASWLLLSAGLLGLARLRRRDRQAA
ncbi:MAG: hypothetical protein EA355_15915 [Rhodobacteraceae bacterium]|nr:MAG: hypothetical protein EA355_15915 [Paracoccaceae bacterium]